MDIEQPPVLTEGEKMIWAASFALSMRLSQGLGVAALDAHNAVTYARSILSGNLLADNDPALTTLRAMVGR